MDKLIYQILQPEGPKKFEFTTKAGITYACSFTLAEDLFDQYPDVASNFYLFNLEVVNGDARLQRPDEEIGATVAVIIENFLLQNASAVVYLCDTSDSREAFRHRKFQSWFAKFNVSKIVKIDSNIKVEDSLILTNLFISRLHPLRDSIINVFLELKQNIEDKAADQ